MSNNTKECGIAGIYATFQAIMQAVLEMRVPAFEVQVKIISTVGQVYSIQFGNRPDGMPVIKEGVLIDGNLMISLCDIAKIDVEMPSEEGALFKMRLEQKLAAITRVNCDPTQTCVGGNCSQEMERLIAQNKNAITIIDYNGLAQREHTFAGVEVVPKDEVISDIELEGTTNTYVTDVGGRKKS